MTGTNVGTAYLEVVPSAKGFAGKLQSQVGGDMGRAGETAGKSYSGGFSKGLKRLAGAAVGLVAVDKVTGFLKDANAEAREAQKVGARTANVIKTTGGVANVTANQVGDLATAISNKAGVDDEAIQTGENLLLTFKNVRNEVGKGNQIFDRATQAAVDLSASGFGDLNGASKQLGKALNDPVKGITALARSGVTFTEGQKKQIKALVESNRTLEAQKIILKEVESQVGGAAAAQATAGDKASVAFKNLEETIGTALLPAVDKFSTFVSEDAAPAITDFVTGMQEGTGAGGEFADVLKTTYEVGKNVVQFVDGLPGPVKKFAVEGLIAVIVLNKINAGMTRVGTSGVVTMVRGLTTAEGRMAAVEKGSYKLGVGLRNLAGAAGTIAVVDGLQRMNDKSSESQHALGALETVGGTTAAGFAAGGPLGAAIGFTVSSLGTAIKTWGLFGTAAKQANEPLKLSAQVLDSYRGSLDGATAAITRNTRELVLQHLQQTGLLDSTRKLGLSDREAVQAMTGNSAARTKLSNAIRLSTDLTTRQKDALREETGAVGKSRLEQLRHNVAIAGSAHELKVAKEALKKFMAQPASKRVTIRGVEDAVGKINSIRSALKSVFGMSADLNVSGPGGLGTLLHVEGAGATGAIVRRPTVALIGESGPEALVPLNRTPGNSALPASGSGGRSADRFVLVLDDGTQLGGYVDRRADSRIGAQQQIAGMRGRAI